MARNVKAKAKGKTGNTKGKAKTKAAAEGAQPPIAVCPTSVLVRLLNRANKFAEEAASARGVIGQEIGEATARQDLHPWAFRIARKLANMSELERAEAVFQLKSYIDALDLDNQQDLLRDQPAAQQEPEVPTSGPGTPTDPDVLAQLGRGGAPEEMPGTIN